jgi:thymidylate kinase
MSISVVVSLPLVTVAKVSKYIALEGVDGSGKSTVARALVAGLASSGEEAILVREPGGTALGEVVRSLLLDSERLDDWAEVFLFAAQRSELAREVVLPALERGTWVVSDRSYYSSIAYQGRGRGLGEEKVRYKMDCSYKNIYRILLWDIVEFLYNNNSNNVLKFCELIYSLKININK